MKNDRPSLSVIYSIYGVHMYVQTNSESQR